MRLTYIITSDKMKINLMYNYNLANPIMYINNNKIYIYNNYEKYLLQEINNYEELKEISTLITSNKLESHYYNIIKTNNNELTMKYNNKEYVLLKISNHNCIIKKIELNNNNILNRSNWYYLWIKKNDYIISIREKIIKENPKVDGIIDYYIGMAENSIEYLKVNMDIGSSRNVYTSLKRYSDINNPINIVLDCRERLFAEKIKVQLFEQKKFFQAEYILNLIRKYDLNVNRVYARLLYPTFFFDIIENNLKIKQISEITKKTILYENILKELNLLLKEKYKIKKIDWL